MEENLVPAYSPEEIARDADAEDIARALDDPRVRMTIERERIRAEQLRKGYPAELLFDAARNSALVTTHISAWRNGRFASFEEMLIALAVEQTRIIERLTPEAVKQEIRAGSAPVRKPKADCACDFCALARAGVILPPNATPADVVAAAALIRSGTIGREPRNWRDAEKVAVIRENAEFELSWKTGPELVEEVLAAAESIDPDAPCPDCKGSREYQPLTGPAEPCRTCCPQTQEASL